MVINRMKFSRALPVWAVVKEVKEVKVERCNVFDNNRNLSWHPDRIRRRWELCLCAEVKTKTVIRMRLKSWLFCGCLLCE